MYATLFTSDAYAVCSNLKISHMAQLFSVNLTLMILQSNYIVTLTEDILIFHNNGKVWVSVFQTSDI